MSRIYMPEDRKLSLLEEAAAMLSDGRVFGVRDHISLQQMATTMLAICEERQWPKPAIGTFVQFLSQIPPEKKHLYHLRTYVDPDPTKRASAIGANDEGSTAVQRKRREAQNEREHTRQLLEASRRQFEELLNALPDAERTIERVAELRQMPEWQVKSFFSQHPEMAQRLRR